jgi:hypothetical protein
MRYMDKNKLSARQTRLNEYGIILTIADTMRQTKVDEWLLC